jgi:hypothetical protein
MLLTKTKPNAHINLFRISFSNNAVMKPLRHKTYKYKNEQNENF